MAHRSAISPDLIVHVATGFMATKYLFVSNGTLRSLPRRLTSC